MKKNAAWIQRIKQLLAEKVDRQKYFVPHACGKQIANGIALSGTIGKTFGICGFKYRTLN